ncbi:MAG: hypothetical protein M3O36_11700 [Myxococcota bacterium]|nr:hypothetical protein [Myxococcota bacterium]
MAHPPLAIALHATGPEKKYTFTVNGAVVALMKSADPTEANIFVPSAVPEMVLLVGLQAPPSLPLLVVPLLPVLPELLPLLVVPLLPVLPEPLPLLVVPLLPVLPEPLPLLGLPLEDPPVLPPLPLLPQCVIAAVETTPSERNNATLRIEASTFVDSIGRAGTGKDKGAHTPIAR